MRYFIEFSYNGANYHGSQKQKNVRTVQEELTKCISLQLDKSIDIYAAGRTDAGVHAIQMFAHFDVKQEIDIDNFCFKLNSFLPNDILVKSIFRVHDNSHARFDAVQRKYKYIISNKREIFNKNVYYLPADLNIVEMNKAAGLLIGDQDFTSFSKVHTQTFTNNCKIIFAKWEEENGKYIFTICANRFLRNMVRSIVGTLIDIGKGKISADMIKEIINKKDRSEAGTSVPAHALFLTEIQYPDTIRKY